VRKLDSKEPTSRKRDERDCLVERNFDKETSIGFQMSVRPLVVPCESNEMVWYPYQRWRARVERRLLRHFVSCNTSRVGFSLRIVCLRSLCLILPLRPQVFQETTFMRNGEGGAGLGGFIHSSIKCGLS
jgi:hypothetical protein